MSRCFIITPKCTKDVNGQLLTPEMVVNIEVPNQITDPFYLDAYEVREAYLSLYNFDYKKAGCTAADFTFSETGLHNSVRKIKGQVQIIDPAYEAYKKRKRNKKRFSVG